MKVSRLIALLQLMPPDATVITRLEQYRDVGWGSTRFETPTEVSTQAPQMWNGESVVDFQKPSPVRVFIL